MPWLVAYDIADPRRLQRLGRFMQKRALRCQLSVFWLDGDEDAVAALLMDAAGLLDPAQDVVQAWRLAAGETVTGRASGTPRNVRPAGVVLGVQQTLFIDP